MSVSLPKNSASTKVGMLENSNQDSSLNIAITATFTAEPIAESLSFWLNELTLNSQIEFAPYNQVFQQ